MTEREEKLMLFGLLFNVAVRQTSIDFWLVFDHNQPEVSAAQLSLRAEIRKLGQELWPG